MKAYTSIEQSKKLAEFLPLESADMMWEQHFVDKPYVTVKPWTTIGKSISGHSCACWSIAALLDVLPKSGKYEPFIDIRYNRIEYHAVDDEIEDKDYLLCYTDGRSLLDACYEMIIKLNELKML